MQFLSVVESLVDIRCVSVSPFVPYSSLIDEIWLFSFLLTFRRYRSYVNNDSIHMRQGLVPLVSNRVRSLFSFSAMSVRLDSSLLLHVRCTRLRLPVF